MKERNWAMLLDNFIFEFLMCLYFAAGEKIGWDAKAWLEDALKYLPVLKKTNKKPIQPTKAPTVEVLTEDLKDQIA